jgi:uncharacterized protein (TIGR02594 family)
MPFVTPPDNDTLTLSERLAVQRRLAAHGFDPGPIDGIFGPRTLAAISAFKRRGGLVTRPQVGPLTWAALEAAPGGAPAVDRYPPWVREGLRIRGWHERADNARLRDWLRSDEATVGDPAQIPWCGDFVETCIRLTLPSEPFPGPLGQNPYWALNWRHFGVACAPSLGAVISITRQGGGHVGIAIGQDAGRYYVLGGNQDNAVSIAPIAKSRFEAASWRRPATWAAALPPLPQMTSAEASAINFF